MCGRTRLTVPFSELAALYRLDSTAAFDLAPRQNLAPTEAISIVRTDSEGRRRLDLVRWGLVPRWARDLSVGSKMFNARVESLARKSTFREAFLRRRCLVLADAFYEWKREGQRKVPHAVRLASGEPFAMAGLWDRWTSPGGEVVESCAVVTRSAEGAVAELHDRMPLVLTPRVHEAWLDRTEQDPARLAALLEAGACTDFAVERLEALPTDAPRASPRQRSLFG